MNDVHHSVDLDLWYVPRMRGKTLFLVFEDGVEYSIREALHISREEIGGADLRAVHAIKKVFGGRLLPDRGFLPQTAKGRRRAVVIQTQAGTSLKRVKGGSLSP
jgi:hypothetical protein